MNSAYFREVRLGDVLDGRPLMGIRQSVREDGDLIPYITTGLVRRSRSVLSDPGSESTSGDTKGRLVQRGDLLTIGRGIENLDRVPSTVVAFDGGAAFAESLLRLRPLLGHVHPAYLQLYLGSRRGTAALLSVMSGTALSSIDTGGLMEVRLDLPSLPVQEKIVEKMNAIDDIAHETEATASLLWNLFDTAREGFVGGILRPEGATK
jgi:restriction endonuclease S subunit